MSEMYDDHKNAIVTGSTRGIGRAIAINLAQAGLNVVISGRSMDAAESLATELQGMGVKSIAVKTDMSNPVDIQKLVGTTVTEFGSVDFLVNNAGVTRDNLAVRMTEEEWDTVLDTNLKGAFLCSRAAAKEMMRKRFGRIVNITSVSGIMGTAGQANYAASKAGMIALTKTFARELGKRNVNVNAIAPGFIETQMTQNITDKARDEYIANIPLKRAGTPEDIANVVRFLVSPAASYITGTVINVSGGLVI